MRRAWLLVVLAGCPRHDHRKTIEPTPPAKKDARAAVPPPGDAAGSAAIALPPAPPLPEVPLGLPPPPQNPAITPEAVALGELLFREPRLASDGKTTCATCHDPAHGYSGTGRQNTAAGQPNLRRAPALVDVAWKHELAWDGRYPSLAEQLQAHVKGQLGRELGEAAAALDADPLYHAHFARTGGPSSAMAALEAYVLTRYAGGAPWDHVERAPGVPAELRAGYELFTGKAQCAVCHTPPLYTDLGYHRLGLIALPDEGRGRVDPTKAGAFATPTLRDAALRSSFFHDGSAPTLDAAIDWHLAGGTGQGADPSIVDLKPVKLTPAERAALGAFVRALTTEPN